jgi:hypothetical protein
MAVGERKVIDLDVKEEKISDFFNKRIVISSSSSESEAGNEVRETGDIEDLIYQTKKHKTEHYESLNISGVPIKYPFKPYPSQIQLMDKVTFH